MITEVIICNKGAPIAKPKLILIDQIFIFMLKFNVEVAILLTEFLSWANLLAKPASD